MAYIFCALIVLLICPSQVHMGVQGRTPSVFSSVGGNATLPCSEEVPPDCSSTEWLYTSSTAIGEVFTNGEINPDVATHGAKRLSLGSDCSLHITDVTTEDVELYTCNFEGVYLSVLQVSASPSETEMEADSTVTLQCVLHTPDDWEGVEEGFSLSWADETMNKLKIINNCRTRTPPSCSITRTKELRGPNPVHTHTCQLTAGGQVQTSVSHTIRVKGVTTASSTSGPSDSCSSSHSSVVHVAVRVATTISLFVAVIIVAVIYRMRSGDPQGKPNTSAHSVYSAVTSQSL